MIKVNFEASSTSKQSMKDYEGWLPHWLKDHFSHFESYLLTYWNNCGRPALDATVEKVLETIVQVQKHAALCLETVKKTEWMLVMEEKWETFVSYFEPHVESLTAKTFEFYYASKSSLASNFVKVQKVATPLIQEAQMFAEPYINQVDVVTKPYLDKAHVTLKPYTEKIVHSYRRFLKSATLYHNQVQEILKTNEITRPLATMELAWFVATGLLSLPIILMLKFYSANFRKKVKKHSRISRSHHTHCRTKRCHPN
ncbi:Myosin heavy chain-like protein [Quillaja saponaria]|nr:Myosin heavy chain-like protein [Quillaja saponaria]